MGPLLPRIKVAAGVPAIDLDPLIPDRIAAAEGYGIALTNPVPCPAFARQACR